MLWIHLLPGGKANLFDILAFKAGRGAWELKQHVRGDWPSLKCTWKKNLSDVLKVVLPCSGVGWAIAAYKGNLVKVLTAHLSLHTGEMEAKNLLCRDLGIVCRGMTKKLYFINLKSDVALPKHAQLLSRCLSSEDNFVCHDFSIDLDIFLNINILHGVRSQCQRSEHKGLENEQVSSILPSMNSLKSLTWFKFSFVIACL